MVAYLGQDLPISTWLDEAPHALERQSYAARELEEPVVCGDGWGFAFYTDTRKRAFCYRSTLPIWADPNRTDLGGALWSHCVVAAARSAHDAFAIALANTQPFTKDELCLVHNGYIKDFEFKLSRKLRNELSDQAYADMKGNSDSEHIFGLLQDAYRDLGPAPAHERLFLATSKALTRLRALCNEARTEARLTLIATDGERMVAARAGVYASPPPLHFTQVIGAAWPGQVIASEPLDHTSPWQPLPEDALALFEHNHEPVLQSA